MADQNSNNDGGYTPTWHVLIRDVHDMDKRISILENNQIILGKTLDELKSDMHATEKTIREVRDAVVGWRSSIGVIVIIGGAVASVIFFFLDHYLNGKL